MESYIYLNFDCVTKLVFNEIRVVDDIRFLHKIGNSCANL